MRKYIDLTGQRFHRLTVLKRVPRPAHQKSTGTRWLVRCDCGTEFDTLGQNLRLGNTPFVRVSSRRTEQDPSTATRRIGKGAGDA